MARGTDMDSVQVRSSGSHSVKINDVVQLVEYPKVKGKPGWLTVRLIGPVYSQAQFWVMSKKGKKFPKPCRCYDPETHSILADKYDPWYDAYRAEADANLDYKDRKIQYQRYFYMQCIVRKLEDSMPAKNKLTASEKKTHIKDMENEHSHTPVRVLRMTNKLFQAVQNMREDNVVKLKSGTKAFHVNHEKFGRDIMIKFDDSNDVAPGDRYQVKLVVDGGRTPLTEQEKEYLIFDMEAIYGEEESEDTARKEYESWAKQMGLGPKRKLKDEDDDEAFDDDDDDFDDEEDEKPKKSSKKVKKSKPVEDEDDFDDDDDFEDDEDEDEKPKKSSKKPVRRDEDDEDDDFDDDDFNGEEEDEKPKKSSKKVKKSKPVEDEDDFDDDDDDFDADDDDFEEEKPKSKKAKKPVAKKSVKKSKPAEDEDDEIEEDDDDDDDDDDDVW